MGMKDGEKIDTCAGFDHIQQRFATALDHQRCRARRTDLRAKRSVIQYDISIIFQSLEHPDYDRLIDMFLPARRISDNILEGPYSINIPRLSGITGEI